jgi:L-2,4-diaminobutyrate decarboxylase
MHSNDELEILERAYDPERFREQGHALVDQLADYLVRAQQRHMPVLPWASPEQQRASWVLPDVSCTTADDSKLTELTGRVLDASQHLHHPGYLGHQVTAPLPTAALLDLVAALLNNSSAVYEMSPANTAMERHVVRWMADTLGLGARADGVLTSGGSAGNLTGLLAARQAMAGYDVWTHGARAGKPLGLLIGEQAHYSASRAAQVMGIGAEGCVAVPSDDRFRLDPSQLDACLDLATRRGLRVFAVVASAGSTATGAYDPLYAVADFCGQKGLWLHVDGAHGAAAALAPRYRHLLAGIDRADSVVWDAHKMLAMPSLVTGVLFTEGERSYDAFSQEAAYLLGPSSREEWFNLSHRTLECTKNGMALKLYGTLALAGESLLAAYVSRCYDLARQLSRQIEDAPDFELATPPEANIVCFRHLPPGVDRDDGEALDAVQAAARQQLIERGECYLVQTVLGGRRYLRVTTMNPLSEAADLTGLLELIRRSPIFSTTR